MESNVVGWFEIYVSDMQRAVKFYAEVFNLGDFTEINIGEERLCMFPSVEDRPYISGALVETRHHSPGVGGTVVYFHSTDCGVEEARIAAAGGEVLRPKYSIGEFGYVCIFKDTEGNLVGIHSRN